jgi:hypothetical protein
MMPAMNTNFRYYHRARRTRTAAILPLLALVVMLSGCAEFGYHKVQIGQHRAEYKAAFPEGQVRRTDTGLSYLDHAGAGQTDAVVIFLTPDHQIAGKLLAQLREPAAWSLRRESSYHLEGQLDPVRLVLAETGPIDLIRALADSLVRAPGDTTTRQSHDLVAAGLTRIAQQWPQVGDPGPAFPLLTEALEIVPGRGTAHIGVDPDGYVHVSYDTTLSR